MVLKNRVWRYLEAGIATPEFLTIVYVAAKLFGLEVSQHLGDV